MRPTAEDLFRDLESESRLRVRERRQLLRSHRDRTRPLIVTWMIGWSIFSALYILGYAGAYSYWATLRWMWDEAWVRMFLPIGHAIPALFAGVYMGVLYSRGRYFFLWGPVVLLVATFLREVVYPWGTADALSQPWWLVWAACAEGMVAGGIAMALGAWLGNRGQD